MLPTTFLKRQFFSISTEEVQWPQRRFADTSSAIQHHLEAIGAAFLGGYHQALGLPEPSFDLPMSKSFYVGFAHEGAGMALGLLDALLPRRPRRVVELLNMHAARFEYLIHVGVGWSLARIPWQRYRPQSVLRHYDEQLRWLILDGFGFHEGYFQWPISIVKQRYPRSLLGYSRRAFDQGLGRSMWFVFGANPRRIRDEINRFDVTRQADLWSGVGLGCAYAGGVPQSVLTVLPSLADQHRACLCQGVVFGVAARHQGQNVNEQTEAACRSICNLSIDQAAELANVARAAAKQSVHGYEAWRTRIRDQFQRHVSTARNVASIPL